MSASARIGVHPQASQVSLGSPMPMARTLRASTSTFAKT